MSKTGPLLTGRNTGLHEECTSQKPQRQCNAHDVIRGGQAAPDPARSPSISLRPLAAAAVAAGLAATLSATCVWPHQVGLHAIPPSVSVDRCATDSLGGRATLRRCCPVSDCTFTLTLFGVRAAAAPRASNQRVLSMPHPTCCGILHAAATHLLRAAARSQPTARASAHAAQRRAPPPMRTTHLRRSYSPRVHIARSIVERRRARK